MAKVVAVLGDYYHLRKWAEESLRQAHQLLNSGDELEIEYCSHEELKEILKQKPDAVILFKENRLNPASEKVCEWMTDELAESIENYVANGGGWLAWHSGLASYPEESAYIRMLRGYFLHHPEKHQLVQYRSQAVNSIVSRPVVFEIVDEHYFVNCDEKNTSVFLTSKSIDGEAAAGWAHTYGEGKVCCLTPAHNKIGLLDPEFLGVLGSCVKWVASTSS